MPPFLTLKNFEGLDLGKMDKVSSNIFLMLNNYMILKRIIVYWIIDLSLLYNSWLALLGCTGRWLWTCFICCWSNWSYSELEGMLDLLWLILHRRHALRLVVSIQFFSQKKKKLRKSGLLANLIVFDKFN